MGIGWMDITREKYEIFRSEKEVELSRLWMEYYVIRVKGDNYNTVSESTSLFSRGHKRYVNLYSQFL